MSKKTWILITCLVLSLSLGLGGSLAYLTDTDTEVNTFTMGNVDIDVEEPTGNDYEMRPGVDIKKRAKIVNTGNNPAWVWMTVAVPEQVADYIELIWNESDNHTLLGVDENLDPVMDDSPCTLYYTAYDKDNNPYRVYTQLWWEHLAPAGEEGSETEEMLKGVKLNQYVDIIDGEYYYIDVNNDRQPVKIDYDLEGMKIIVSGYAIQTDGFEKWEDAYKAYRGQWGDLVVKTEGSGDNSNKWPVMEPTVFEESTTVEAVIRLENDDPNATDCVTAAGEGVVVEIIDGSYHIGNNYGPCAVWAKDGATVKIMSGEYVCEARDDLNGEKHIDLIYAGSGADETYGRIEIYGGYFFAEGSTPENPGAWLLNENDTYGTIVVKGGVFGNWNPADNVSEGPHTNFVADGYTVWKQTEESGWEWYHVMPEDATPGETDWVQVYPAD